MKEKITVAELQAEFEEWDEIEQERLQYCLDASDFAAELDRSSDIGGQ